jgi:hypothetical protein
MISWNDRQYYSIEHDADMARVSGFDERHQEHWMMIECGKGYADRRRDAVLKILDAIEDGHMPGEVVCH